MMNSDIVLLMILFIGVPALVFFEDRMEKKHAQEKREYWAKRGINE